ncbi:hypothetical protein [Secundilactobacillus paracollinoides]|nr:hypothetical protein [Secundilactobacillus paracollinoides]
MADASFETTYSTFIDAFTKLDYDQQQQVLQALNELSAARKNRH